ncbi:hypothetical protein PPL19_01535 [Pseudomonas psychrotolerans L19]|uniref:DUF2254 domain-containing protein n=1 Tax=Pseudomonas oryzihabitans TaxID=47885 RepID=UPI00023A556C|nr:DUF2254 domain-containing protein [Pseudomonas psychrotolerans]EHK72884.1 hypothetical protein PPL19_01535 [Pseudomonas psychrotolerans L19]MBA1181597.1 DUF2254 domain-containing protein [Pseudomonas psychrotolerans]MBA1213129.1 DUF2254 domain-containing protein [Pseudomonas psychrotolerans]
MLARLGWVLRGLQRRLWFRATLFSVAGVATALLALLLRDHIPTTLPAKVGADAVDKILTIIASSMLAVTTFSLSTMVTAYNAAASSVTPRAYPLLLEDSTTQNALATFLGSFLFSLVGIIALSTGLYGDNGRVVLFAVTLVVILLIVFTLLRWIDHLSRLGQLDATSDSIEDAARHSLQRWLAQPYLDGVAAPVDEPARGRPVMADRTGYLQRVDMPLLADLCGDQGRLRLAVLPGAFLDPAQPLLWVEGLPPEKDQRLRAAFTLDARRVHDQDPRFGLTVLGEIATGALVPSRSDSGTAIAILGRAQRLLTTLTEPREAVEPRYPRIEVPDLSLDDLFDDFFLPVGRDAAPLVEVGMRLQKALARLAVQGDARIRRECLRHSRLALARAEATLGQAEDRVILQQLAADVERLCTARQ